MAINTTLPGFSEWWRSERGKTFARGLYSNQIVRSMLGLEEKSTGESFTLPAPATDSTPFIKQEPKTSYTSGSLTITNGTLKLTPELEAAIDEQARIFASTI